MKRYTDAMNEVRFTPEEKQELSARLRQAAQSAPQHTRKPKRHRMRRAVCGALAAALAVTMLTAAAVPAFGDTLRAFFGMPVDAYGVGKSVERDGWTFTVEECLVDDNVLYTSIQVQMPESFPIDELKAEFQENGITDLNDLLDDFYIDAEIALHASGSEEEIPYPQLSDTSCMKIDLDNRTLDFVCFKQFHTTGQSSAQLSSIESFDLSIQQVGFCSLNDNSQDIALFQDNFYPLSISDIPLQPVETIYLTPNDEVPIYGGTSTLTSLSISPLFVTVRVEGGSCYNHGWVLPTHPEYLLSPETARLIAEGKLENTTCDCDFDLHLKYKDGRVVFIGHSLSDIEPDYSVVSSSSGGTYCEDGIDYRTKQPNGKDTYVSTSVRFAVPQDLGQIESVIVCGKEYKLR
ncbi:hypothetical protein B5F17_12920 [Butyricicoccus pullicaecorum]|uniref:DUF4179 domain-containing protein n=1 Tax=Butyricicoccus pullicaecorum TaxID=501571 RepID=A0A1Y4L3Q2_9FIRM|nr:DUF4179 domain-containing protein [Butyricicoccus pullicaecorum]OUP51427.1 hypothetical protein B5F17_12920 [Butyricicoccus pullicaecorum]